MGYKISKGFMWVREPNIPAEYQEVEWIGTSGSQYIDTGVKCSTNLILQFKYVYTKYGGGCLIGNHSTESDDFRFFRADNDTYLDYGNATSGSGRISGSYITSTTDIYETEIGNCYVKDITSGTTKFSGSTKSFTKSYNVRIGKSASHSTEGGNFYYVKIYDNGALIRDLIPCYRKSDNVIGMYDKVGGQFYTNAGTGTFTKGNNVDPTYEFKEKQFYPGAGGGGALFEIETDFRNYSNISDVYALGWGAGAKGSMQPAVNSTYGFYCGNYNSYWGGQWLYYDISSYMANAKKIYAHLTGYMPGGYTYQANERIVLCNISRIDGNGETIASDQFRTELKGGSYNNNTNIGKAVGGASYTKLVDYGSSNYTGNVDITFEINLESGLVTSVITQPSSISMQYTLSASEISWIKSTLKFIDFAFTTYATRINNYITTAHIKIE